MLAWILNTKPVKGASAGSPARVVVARAAAAARVDEEIQQRLHAEVVDAEPKNTGVCLPAR
jgi:hypothetical protein